jgi:hypothetical protein
VLADLVVVGDRPFDQGDHDAVEAVPQGGAAAPPAFLHTPTLDVGLVLSGQIVLEMEDGTAAELSTGQAFAQRSTPHRWRNPHPVDAVIPVVMMGQDR